MEITGQKDNKTERIPDNYVMMTETTGGRNKYQNSEWKKRKCSVESASKREITSHRSIARKKKRNIDTSCIFTQMCDEADLTPPVFTHNRYRERDRKCSMFFSSCHICQETLLGRRQHTSLSFYYEYICFEVEGENESRAQANPETFKWK